MPSNSLWLEENIPQFDTFTGEASTDAVIIGGGITGLSCAYLLKKAGVRVILLEANRICRETSGHTTAKITSQQSQIYTELNKKWGKETAHKYAAASQNAIEQIQTVINELNIQCDFERQQAHTFAFERNRIPELEEELNLAQEFGIASGMSQNGGLPIPVAATMYFENQAMFHPVKYMIGLANSLNGDECTIYENSRVLEVEKGIVKTEKGAVSAKCIIVATHYPFINFPGLYWVKMYQSRSVALAVKGLSIENMHRSIDNDGLSFRKHLDYTIIGMSDFKAGTEGDIHHYDRLTDYVVKTFPQAEITNQWTTQDCMSPDGLPFIGIYSKATPNMFVATGFSKWGMTNSMISAQIIRDMITDKDNEYADIFAPDRSVLNSVKQISQVVLTAGAEYAKKLVNPHKPTCSHLGCKLNWNEDERSWDCPCHGSRFDENGKVLQGPAVRDIEIEKV